MKHVMASLTIGACLLLPSAGTVLGADPHGTTNPSTNPGPAKGRPSQSCQAVIGGGGSAPGNTTSANSPGSPFSTAALAGTGGVSVSHYAGVNSGSLGAASGVPASQYDVACFQQP
jgi:hypothetical protein